jgi:hypothetical protein
VVDVIFKGRAFQADLLFWCQKVGKPMTKAAQACFVMVLNFSAEYDCNLKPLWFYGFGGLRP